jgi:hypothetical protein
MEMSIAPTTTTHNYIPVNRIRANIKNWISTKNTTFLIQGVRKLVEEKFPVTKGKLLPICEHGQEVEEKYIQNEQFVGSIVEELSDFKKSGENEDISMEGILPLSSDSE